MSTDQGSRSGATPLPNVRVGEVLAGKYRIEKVLGIGGMGVVVAAHHLHLDEKVAIKFLLPEAARNPEAVGRFLREARAAIKIKSEHVARVTDVGTLEDGTAFLVMEYLNGRDLASWVRDDGPLAVEQAVEFVVQACEALAEAHALGIVHRDLKPANLFVIRRADGLLAVRVLDFGISKLSGGGSSENFGLTKTNQAVGSPCYMSPEQLRASRDVDGRSDIWSLGIVLYELLAGSRPFAGDSMPIICSRILEGVVAPLRALRPDVPAGLESAILRCLETNPSRRFNDVAELAAALVGFGPARARFSAERIARTVDTGPVRPPGSGAGARPPAPTPSPPAMPRSAPPGGTLLFPTPSPGLATIPMPPGLAGGATRRGRKRGLGWGAVVVGTVAAGVAAWLVLRSAVVPEVGSEAGVAAPVASGAKQPSAAPMATPPPPVGPVGNDPTTEAAAAAMPERDRSLPSPPLPEPDHAAPTMIPATGLPRAPAGPKAVASPRAQIHAVDRDRDRDHDRSRRRLLDLADERK